MTYKYSTKELFKVTLSPKRPESLGVIIRAEMQVKCQKSPTMKVVLARKVIQIKEVIKVMQVMRQPGAEGHKQVKISKGVEE